MNTAYSIIFATTGLSSPTQRYPPPPRTYPSQSLSSCLLLLSRFATPLLYCIVLRTIIKKITAFNSLHKPGYPLRACSLLFLLEVVSHCPSGNESLHSLSIMRFCTPGRLEKVSFAFRTASSFPW